MIQLTGAQKRTLRGWGHALEPLVHIGKAGLTEAVFGALDRGLADHELIKVRFLAGREEMVPGLDRIVERLGCAVAGKVGHVALLYRPDPDPDRRRFDLP